MVSTVLENGDIVQDSPPTVSLASKDNKRKRGRRIITVLIDAIVERIILLLVKLFVIAPCPTR